MVTAPEMITVHPSVPAKTVKGLIDLLKANPGKYSYASPGYGTTRTLAAVAFKLEYGIDITHVPFRAQRRGAVVALGQTPVFHNVLPAVAPHIRQGTIARSRSPRPSARRSSPTCRRWPGRHPGHEVGFWWWCW
jgi:tripartite-type tricarboxylate transporter receptor subunit TctC